MDFESFESFEEMNITLSELSLEFANDKDSDSREGGVGAITQILIAIIINVAILRV